MSGVIGKLSYEHDEPLARPALEQMIDALRHRGAGPRGIFMAPGIALGCWSDDHRPAWGPVVARTEDESIRVAADASLTNALDLRRQLEREGRRFDGRTQGELIAHAYEAWGDRAVERFDGPFACAIWDRRRRRLLLARDHLGIRPLYFALLQGHGIVFASEPPALLQDPGVGREFNPAAIDAYLALGYVPAPLTAYKRISKLEPAQRLTVEGRRFHLESFWDVPAPERPGRETAAELEDALRTAIAARSSDTARTILFSGGRASAALLVTAAGTAVPVDAPGPHVSPRASALVVALDQDASDLAGADALVRHVGADPSLEVAGFDAASAAARLAARLDEPIADPAALVQYTVLQAARPYATAAHAGHGAAAWWDHDARHSTMAGLRPAPLWAERERRAVYTRGFAWAVKDVDALARHRDLFAARDTGNAFDRARYVQARTTLPDSTLAIADRAAHAAGVRLDLPFLDRQVVALACRFVPGAAAQGGGADPIRALLARRLPAPLVPPARPAVDTAWLRRSLAALVPRTLLAHRFDGRGILSRPALQQVWDEHCSARRDHTQRLWSLLMLELWFREFIDGDVAAEPIEHVLSRVA